MPETKEVKSSRLDGARDKKRGFVNVRVRAVGKWRNRIILKRHKQLNFETTKLFI